MITLYGIKNCDTVKKARKWLTDHNVEHQFHDFRQDGLTQDKIESWLSQLDWTKVLNKRSTSYRQLTDDVKENINRDNLATLLAEHPTLIKRPVVETQNQVLIGFNDKQWQSEIAE